MLAGNQLIGFGAGGGAYRANAVRFDGVNDYLTRGAGFTGGVDSNKIIGSVWLNFQGGDGSSQRVLITTGTTSAISRTTANKIFIDFENSAGALTFRVTTTTTFAVANGWQHLLFSADLSVPAATVWVNDAKDATAPTLVVDTMDFTRADWAVGGDTGGTNKLNAEIADLYVNFGAYLDFNTLANRRKFIDALGKPVDLGADGSRPTGTPPVVFLSKAAGSLAHSFAANKGSGGGFTVTGALTDGANSPSD